MIAAIPSSHAKNQMAKRMKCEHYRKNSVDFTANERQRARMVLKSVVIAVWKSTDWMVGKSGWLADWMTSCACSACESTKTEKKNTQLIELVMFCVCFDNVVVSVAAAAAAAAECVENRIV